MTEILIRLFIKNRDNPTDSKVRGTYGKFASVIGMIINLMLFSGKLIVGLMANSIAIISDSVNNLSDAATSFINLFGFIMSGKPADKDHPFGHGRIEYITGLIMSFLILLIGFEFARTSFDRIVHPETIHFSIPMIFVLAASILLKFWLFFFYRKIGNRIASQSILAASVDSISDVLVTLVTLIALVVSQFTTISIDGYVGLVVSAVVLFAGYKVAKDALSPLLGRTPDLETVKTLSAILTSDPNVLGVHDVILHDYGPGRVIASAHVEVSSHANFMDVHDAVDLLEKRIVNEMGIPTTIHMDPINSDDEKTKELREFIRKAIGNISPKLSLHDFRMVTGKTHTNLIFDLSVPSEIKMSNDEIRAKLEEELAVYGKETYFLVIQFDRYFL